LTPSKTLLPPPTFEPPTLTRTPSPIPSLTPSATLDVSVSIPGLHGAETPTPTSTAGCVPRKDWTLIYVVQRDDALATIAEKYNTYVDELVAANCLTNKNLITIGQELRVPGTAHPAEPVVECFPYELITPMNGPLAIAGGGGLTVNWRGPRAPYNLIRVHKPDGSTFEIVVELRQNETIILDETLRDQGTYTWYIYPLDSNFVQVCPEGGPWTFSKQQAPTPTPTLEFGSGF
jgi:LysM repeat protein